MRSCVAAFALLIITCLFASPGLEAQVVPPADALEPVRLTLEECIALGLDQNPGLAVNEAQVDQARSGVMQAKANKMPSVSMSANVLRSNKLTDFGYGDPTMFPVSMPFADASGTPVPGLPAHVHLLAFPSFEISSTREGDIYQVKVEAQYALYAGGKIKNGIKAAELNVQASEEGVRQKKNELVFNITQAFYGLLLTQEVVVVVDEAYATADAHYQQVKAFYNEGMVSSLDVLKVESMLADIRPQQIQARNGLDLARLGLNNLLNIDLATRIEAVGELAYDHRELPLPEDLYSEALANRPEMKTMELRRQMAGKLLEIAKANAYPTVGLFANYAWDRGAEMPPNDKKWVDGYQAGAGVSVPLFDGRATEGKVGEAQAQMRQVEYGKRALELGIRTQVQQAVLNVMAAEKKIAAEEASVEAAQKEHQTARTRYAVGLATNIDVMDAQTQLSQAKLQRLSAINDYNLAWAQLEAALGRPEER